MVSLVNHNQEGFTPDQGENHSYSADRNELPSIEDVVRKILETERAEHEMKILELESKGDRFAELLKRKDSYWEKQKELYTEVEGEIRGNRGQEAFPSWEVAGSLNYAMSPCEMKSVITRKFREMVLSGHLMSEQSLNNDHARETFFPTTGRGGSDLTRIWGAEFLRSNLQEHGTLNAAEHFLIVDDTAEEIEVRISMNNDYPHLSGVNNAHVISKKVGGVGDAWNYRYSTPLTELRYRDFKDPGNIIRDAQGIGWVVDTELKSFDPPEQSPDPLYQHYLKRRYKALSTEDCSTYYQIFKIKVADLNLK